MSLILKQILKYSEKAYGNMVKRFISEIKKRSCFEHLVLTIISQNTNWKNVKKAAENLRKILGEINPYTISSASLEDLEEALKPAGLYKVKSRWLKEIAYIIIKNFNGSLNKLKNLSADRAREILLKMPGVGFKTADIILCFCFSKPVLPIDTHIKRISRRIGLVSSSNYDTIRRELEKHISPGEMLKAHLLLILFGRNICRARNPLCRKCPVNDVCPSSMLKK
ncbi:MAG TPA: endonuclease III [Acidilobales archaeon]|nr:endonuclease III [Acidilobales archaeon]